MRFFRSALVIIVSSIIIMLVPSVMAYDLFAPEVITVDGNGSVYALIWGNDTVSNAIHLFSHGGRETVIPIGNNIDITTDKDGNLYMLNHPSNYFLSDITIQKMGLNGTVSTIYTNDRSDFAEKMINSIAVDNNGTIYFSYFNMTQPYYGDPGGLRFIQTYENTSYIASISPNGTINKVYSDNSTPISGTARISVDSNGTIYVGDYSNTIKVIDSKGKVRLIPTGFDQHYFISDVAIGRDGYLYTAIIYNHIYLNNSSELLLRPSTVQKFSINGTLINNWTGCGPEPFTWASSIAADEPGRVYVADQDNQRIVWFDSNTYRYGENIEENTDNKGKYWDNVIAGDNATVAAQKRWDDMIKNSKAPANGLSFGIAVFGLLLAAIAVCYNRNKNS